jgi:NAD(P)-dependent dehydrogenase (short-subunit alcohol dehydrogenase family)
MFARQYAGRYDIIALYRRRPPRMPTQWQRLIDPLEPDALLGANDHPLYEIRADLEQPSLLEATIEHAVGRFGRIDLLVNAIGVRQLGDTVGADDVLKSVQRHFEINATLPLRVSVLVARRAWRDHKDENLRWNRSVVNVSALAGLEVNHGSGDIAFAASKAALNMITCHLADEFAQFGVRVNAVAPEAFPAVIPTERVIEAAETLASGAMTGRILAVQPEGMSYIV